MFPVTEKFHSNRKSYKRHNTGKLTTWTYGVIDECANAAFDSDEFISSDVVRIYNFRTNVAKIKTYLPILDAEDIRTWGWMGWQTAWFWLYIHGYIQMKSSSGFPNWSCRHMTHEHASSFDLDCGERKPDCSRGRSFKDPLRTFD